MKILDFFKLFVADVPTTPLHELEDLTIFIKMLTKTLI